MRSLGSQTIKSQIILMIRNNDLDPKKARKQSGGKRKRGRKEIHLEEKRRGNLTVLQYGVMGRDSAWWTGVVLCKSILFKVETITAYWDIQEE